MSIILTTRYFSILWSKDAHGGFLPMEARTIESLRENQRRHVAQNPAVDVTQEIHEPIQAYIGMGAWRIPCRCNCGTHTDPEWKIACCFSCGAVYTNVVFPDNYKAIEEMLLKRPVQMHRGWLPTETLDDLVAEQIAHGDPV